MMRLLRPPARLVWSTDGAIAVEFALVGPALIALLLAVVQIGLGMQNYNAVRSVAAETARYAMVNYQTGNKLSNTQLANYGRTVGMSPPYGLVNDRLAVVVSQPASQRVTGARELTITITYSIPTVLSVIGIGDIPMTYSRPVFLLDS